jgi:predicted enzyme related to lactoylglutathione lyase
MEPKEDWARPLVHWEIQAREPAKQREFYAQMFNWQIGDGPVMLIPAGIGAPDPDQLSGHIVPGDASRTVLYIQVLDLRASMEKAASLGGSVVAQPFDVPNGPTIARIADPEGNQIGLVQQ